MASERMTGLPGCTVDFSDPEPHNMEASDERGAIVNTPSLARAASDGVSLPEAQRFTDSVIRRVFLWMFPRWIRPNHLTILRFVLIPVVLLLLYFDLRWWGFGVFVVAACTDFIDGTMARTRGQITPVGIVIDPVADKLLIGAVLAWIGYEYLVVQIILAFIGLELVLMAVGLGISRPDGRARPSNVFGKSKMVVQSIALILFLIAGILDLQAMLDVSLYLLWVAIALAALSGLRHVNDLVTARRAQSRS